MNITRIKIGGQIYKIVRPKEVLFENEGETISVSGTIDHVDGIIAIQKSYTGDFLDITFLHEALHGILSFCGIGEKLTDNEVDALAKAVHMILKDNPRLFKAVK